MKGTAPKLSTQIDYYLFLQAKGDNEIMGIMGTRKRQKPIYLYP